MPKEKNPKEQETEVEDIQEQEAQKSVETIETAEVEVELENNKEIKEVAESVRELEIDSEETVTVQPVKFASFEDLSHSKGDANKNLDILMDIKLQLTVELGRTELPIKKVLELTRGSIIELEKVAGEPVELYANGKLVAHGEIVVIEDNFGLRITSITEPEEILKGM